MNKDYYKILLIDKNANLDLIKKAYRKLAMQYHPDKNKSTLALDKFKLMSLAYLVLSSPDKRRQYDQFGNNPFGNGFDWSMFTHGNLFGDMFNSFFNPFQNMHQHSQRNERVRTIIDLEMTLQLIYNGVFNKLILFDINKPCLHCKGSGSLDGVRDKCNVCNGAGRVVRSSQQNHNTVFQTVMICLNCNGVGTKVINVCKTCNGNGHNRLHMKIVPRIMKGFYPGTMFQIYGDNLNLVIGRIQLLLHLKFKVVGYNNTLSIKVLHHISVADAIHGTTIKFRYLNDLKILLNVPLGTNSGTIQLIRDKGLVMHDRPNSTGSLLNYIIVDIPKYSLMSDKQKKLITLLKKMEN